MAFKKRWMTRYLLSPFITKNGCDDILRSWIAIPANRSCNEQSQTAISSNSLSLRELFNSERIFMKWLLVSFILNGILSLVATMNGVIWSKTQQTFVPISNIPIYAKIQQERLEKSRMLETYNFQLQNLTLTSFEVYSCSLQITVSGYFWTHYILVLRFPIELFIR